ncbi:helix-turn-helix domain-containing protein [Streptomyces sp. NPDC006422]|uniref:helix-turn-helix domain-containing protein n=1 Tax=unclassified Streptomyces TaxID=2593676 RepID=UPI0033BB967B
MRHHDATRMGSTSRTASVTFRGSEALELGRQLHAVRTEQGLPLARAAASAGLSPLWAAQIECGEVLDLETLHAYARALGARLTVRLDTGLPPDRHGAGDHP